MGQEFPETHQVVSAFIPVDLQDGANDGDWVSMRGYRKLTCILFKAVGTAGDDPTVTLEQATAVAGTGAKALTIIDRIYTKQGADLTTVGINTLVTQTVAATYTDDTSAELAAIWQIDINAEQLDVTNGFDVVRMRVADIGANPQLGCGIYILSEPNYPQNILESAIVD